jgi:hypothetical protein
MLPIQPKLSSATPMMMFTGHSHQAILLSHIQTAGPTQYDSLLMVNRIGVDKYCLIVALEVEVAGQPLNLVIYAEKGRQVISMNKAAPITRTNFLAASFVIVEKLLHDRLQLPVPPQGKPLVEEKPLQEFYPDAGQRLKLHYHFAHRWLPAYAKSDPACFFGYFQRGEQEPTKFVQARWQMMEQELKLIPSPPAGRLTTAIRRISDLKMRVDMSGRYPFAVVQMPLPEFMTHAYYIGIVLLSGKGQGVEPPKSEAKVFTLEKIEQSSTEGRLCEWAIAEREISHRNYGTQVPVTREEFIKAVLSKIAEPVRVPIASASLLIGASGAG